MRVLVLGGTGFLGSRLVATLNTRGHRCVVLTRNPSAVVPFDRSRVEFVHGDLTSPEVAEIVPGTIDTVVYVAMPPIPMGRVSPARFRILAENVRLFLKHTVEIARRKSARLILTTGASFVTNDNQVADESWPIARIGMASIGNSFDEVVGKARDAGDVDVVEMIPGQIYGNGGKFERMIAMARSGRATVLGSGKNHIPRLHVADCVDAYVRAVESKLVDERFILADDTPCTVRDFTSFLAALFGETRVRRVPDPILRLVVGNMIYRTLTMNTIVSNRHAKEVLGWMPEFPSYREGLRDVVRRIIGGQPRSG